MNLAYSVTQKELMDVLLNVSTIRPIFIWGAPGIGKSALVKQFANEVGLPCVSLLGSQLAPEDIIGIPRINEETSEFLVRQYIPLSVEESVALLHHHAGMSWDSTKADISVVYNKYPLATFLHTADMLSTFIDQRL